MFIAVRRGFHLVSGFGEKLIVFRSSFFSAGLCPAWTQGERIGGDGFQHASDKFSLFARGGTGGMDGGGPVAQGIEGTLEADALQGNVVEMSGLLHEGAHEVVGDQMDLEFLVDHARALAAQDVELEDGLDLGKVEFDGPAPGVEFANGVGGIKRRVRQGGGKQDETGAEPRRLDDDADQPYR